MPLEQLKTASKKAVGTKQVLRAIEKNAASLVFVAQDADADIIGKINTSCQMHGVEIKPRKEQNPTRPSMWNRCSSCNSSYT